MIGKILGSYTIEGQLGSGGMAQVYRGRHVHLERDVAIKVMHAHLSDQQGLRERFLNEARANAGLQHSGIVQVYDFDVADGVAYIAMEILDGQSLEDHCRELADGGGRFELDEALDIVTAVAEALSYAHARGVVHRDIKPSNVMMTADGRAVLTDFGLATVLDQTRMTTDGTSAGTPSYMSPEQASGERGDHRSDVYSLGVVTYQLLAGELPLQSETLVGMINKLINEPAPLLTETAPEVPERVSDAVTRALDKDPACRFDSIEEMVVALRGQDAIADWSRRPPTLRTGIGGAARGSAAARRGAAAARWVAIAAAVVAVAGLGWWALVPDDRGTEGADNAGSGGQLAVDGDGGDAASGSVGSMAAEPESMAADAESMVPDAQSMVPSGEAAIGSMAPIAGWLDTFDDNTHGWEISNAPIARSLVDGQYEIDLTLAQQAVSATALAGGEFTNFEYRASGSLVEGQSESGYGLMFRRVDARNYYVFAVNGLGQWSIWALEGGAWRELRSGNDPWTPSDAIDPAGFNELLVSADGERITASVNGVELVTLTDATFVRGGVGFYTASSRTAANARTRVRFDDAEVTILR